MASGSSGTTYGVYGQSNSIFGRGVYGVATATSGQTYGVSGESHSPSGAGIFGFGINGAAAGSFVGGIQLRTFGAVRPTCDSDRRGTLWFTEGGSGYKDSLYFCAKDASNVYSWRTLY